MYYIFYTVISSVVLDVAVFVYAKKFSSLYGNGLK